MERSSAGAPRGAGRGATSLAADAGTLVRGLRQRAGLTQRQLAIRAGTTTTALSRLERGHISPTVQTLSRLLLCLGYRLELGAVPMTPAIDPSQLAAVAQLGPDARLDHALASQSSLRRLVGTARRGAE